MKLVPLEIWLVLAAALSCSEQVAEPIKRGPPVAVFVPSQQDTGPILQMADDEPRGDVVNDAGGPAGPEGSSDPFSADASANPAMPGGLCAACRSRHDCGGPEDYCVLNTLSGESFCGTVCASDLDCPADFSCTRIRGLSESSLQCVPQSSSCYAEDAGQAAMDPTLTAVNLDRINARRADLGRQPLQLDACLSRIADESQTEFLELGELHTKFERECRGLSSACECDWDGEFQIDVARDGRTPAQVLEQLYSAATYEGWVGGSMHRRVGFVVAYNETTVWVTNAYGP